MERLRIVLDTNVLVAALRSRLGASYRLLSLVGTDKFQICVSVPLVLEYEDAARRLVGEIPLTQHDIDDMLDYICSVASRVQVFYLWRPFLSDPGDDMVLELAVTAGCSFIITHNKRHFQGVERFALLAVTPREFLEAIGEAP